MSIQHKTPGTGAHNDTIFLMLSPKHQIALVSVLGLATGGAAMTLALGLSLKFDFYNHIISFGSVLLALVALVQGYRNWAFPFLVASIVFSPFLSILSLERYQWTILDITLSAYIVYFVARTTDPYLKGIAFEQHVATLFPPEKYTIVDRTRDISKFADRTVESDSHPDFVFRNKETGKVFAVECKYASRWYESKGTLGFMLKKYQLDNYRRYASERGIPVYMALGIGGIPKKPKEAHFVPLEWIKYDFVYQSLVRGGMKAGEF